MWIRHTYLKDRCVSILSLFSDIGKSYCLHLSNFWKREMILHTLDFRLDGKASAYNVGDLGSIPGLGRSPGQGNGNPLQYSCLENPMDRGAWQATVPEVTKSQTQLSDFTHSLALFTPKIIAHLEESTNIKAVKKGQKKSFLVFQRLTVLIPWNLESEPARKAKYKLSFQNLKFITA